MTPEQLAGAQNAISFLSGLLDEGQSGNGRHEGGRLRSFSRERSGGRSCNEEKVPAEEDMPLEDKVLVDVCKLSIIFVPINFSYLFSSISDFRNRS